MSGGIKVIPTQVECPCCRALLCNLCGINGACQMCGHQLPEAVLDDIAGAVRIRNRNASDPPEPGEAVIVVEIPMPSAGTARSYAAKLAADWQECPEVTVTIFEHGRRKRPAVAGGPFVPWSDEGSQARTRTPPS